MDLPETPKLDVRTLLLNDRGIWTEFGLLVVIGILAFLSLPFYSFSAAPWLFFVAFTYFWRTSSWGIWKSWLAVVVVWGLSSAAYFTVNRFLVALILLYVVCLTSFGIFDRIAFHRMTTWMCQRFQNARRPSMPLRMVLAVRCIVCSLILPLLYSGFYHCIAFLPSPLHAGNISDMAYTQINNDIRMLSAIGGTPLISLTMSLFGTVVAAILLSRRIENRGTLEWLKYCELPNDSSTRHLEERLLLDSPKERILDDSNMTSNRVNCSPFNDSTPYDGGYAQLSGPGIVPSQNIRAPYMKVGSLLRRAMVPIGLLLFILLSTGPLTRILFNRKLFLTESRNQTASTTFVKMGCAPSYLHHSAVKEAAEYGTSIMMTGEGAPHDWATVKRMSKKYNMAMGLSYYNRHKSSNSFDLFDGDGNDILHHDKFNPVPMMETLNPVKPVVDVVDVNIDAFGGLTPTNPVAKVTTSRVIDDEASSDSTQEVTTASNDERVYLQVRPKRRRRTASWLAKVPGDVVRMRLGAAICFDMYDSIALSQAGRSKVDMMLVPSNLWGPLYDAHSAVLRMRAIENGFVLFTCTFGGISGAFGPFGEIYGQTYSYDDSVVYDVPVTPQIHSSYVFRTYPKLAVKFGSFLLLAGCLLSLLGIILPS